MYYPEYKDLHEIYKEDEIGDFAITFHNVPESDVLTKVRSPEMAGQLDQTVVVLRDRAKQEVVMSDSWMECATNIEFVRKAKGDVLIAGLGLGLIILAIQDKPEVTSITVVEKEQGIYDLVMPYLVDEFNDKVKIVISDIHHYKAEIKFDTVYHDIWNDISEDNLDEMIELKDEFGGKCWRWYSTVALAEGEDFSEEDYE